MIGKNLIKDSWMKILLLSLVVIVLAFEMRSVFAFIVITAVSFIFNYYQNRFRLPFDLSPMVFFSTIVAVKMGFIPMIAFLVISGIIPTLMAGGEISLNTFVFMAHIILLNVMIAGLNISLALLAFIYPVALGIMMLSVTTLSNEQVLRRIAVPVMAVAVNMVYFMNLGRLLF
jgi:hypothetical protein